MILNAVLAAYINSTRRFCYKEVIKTFCVFFSFRKREVCHWISNPPVSGRPRPLHSPLSVGYKWGHSRGPPGKWRVPQYGAPELGLFDGVFLHLWTFCKFIANDAKVIKYHKYWQWNSAKKLLKAKLTSQKDDLRCVPL